MPSWLFLCAYAVSGFAGLVYEVTWTRLLTLQMGHTTAAASAVVAAFMGGLAIGSAGGGRIAARLTPRQALYGYAALEGAIVLLALAIPFTLRALAPLLAVAYRDGAPGLVFPLVRLMTSIVVLTVPAVALGATFPFAVRWFVADPQQPGPAGGRLYAVNTAGAAIGALAAGFVLMPRIGVTGAGYVGVAASAASVAIVLAFARAAGGRAGAAPDRVRPKRGAPHSAPGGSERTAGLRRPAAPAAARDPRWLAGFVVALTGFATFFYEIAWTRTFAMIVGPSTYAFAATLTGFIGGLAVGAWAGASAARASRPAAMLSFALSAAGLAATAASIWVGGELPRRVAKELAAGRVYGDLLFTHSALVAAAIVPTAIALGIAFPLALALAGDRNAPVARVLGGVYAVNTVAAVAGSLTAGFIAIRFLGLQGTIGAATVLLALAAFGVAAAGRLTIAARTAAAAAAIAAAVSAAAAPGWDQELLASGVYKYARRAPPGVDPATALKAGTLLYYREGATGTVSVRKLTGQLSLAIDGKVDASTAGDMITQKTLAHLPLLLHAAPRHVLIVGFGSGVTAGSALVHPVAALDVVEISPEVMEASSYFARENRDALRDPRTRLIVGDGRTHLALSRKQYDVIVSEPSNPWMAGVAALFTREFFITARRRLAPGGIVCQWAHTYDISPDDLRSIAATFASVFPDGTMWLVGNGDLLLVGSVDPIEPRLAAIEDAWRRPRVADDLARVGLRSPFALMSLYVGGPAALRAYGQGAPAQTDSRMALEFTGPRALNSDAADENVAALRALLPPERRPPAIAAAYARAGAADWRDRGEMLSRADAYDAAYADYARAVKIDPRDTVAAAGLVRAAAATNRHAAAAAMLRETIAAHPGAAAPRIALSKLLAAAGSIQEAVQVAREAAAMPPPDPDALEQLASLYADTGDADRLDEAVAQLQPWAARRAAVHYYAAAGHFLRSRYEEAAASARQAIALDPRHAPSRNLLGAILASQGQTEPARTAFGEAMALDPRDAAVYVNLALLEMSNGRGAAAADLFAEALSLDPSSAAARQGLAQLDPDRRTR